MLKIAAAASAWVSLPLKHPGFTPDDDFSQLGFGPRVVERQVGVVEHAQELRLLIGGVAECFCREIAALHILARPAGPLDEARHQRSHVRLAERSAAGARLTASSAA